MTKAKRIKATFDQEKDEGIRIETSIPSSFYESMVRISFSRCVVKRKVCLSNVTKDKTLLKALYAKLGKLENHRWSQVINQPREKGISIEGKDQSMHKELKKEMPEADTFGHFRVDHSQKGIFRVYGARTNNLFYILYFDVDGKKQH